jgi:hypothetical protein
MSKLLAVTALIRRSRVRQGDQPLPRIRWYA